MKDGACMKTICNQSNLFEIFRINAFEGVALRVP